MGVERHLGVSLAEYDERIRTFVPWYETMLGAVAGALELVPTTAPVVVDLGIGTGALAEACLRVKPGARLIGVDADAGMLEAARARLAGHPLELVRSDFRGYTVPRCDVVVQSLALHHLPRPEDKLAVYAGIRAALAPDGVFVTADCLPGATPGLAARHRRAWLDHLERTYTPAEARDHLTSWADEDTYFSLVDELGWLERAGFLPEVVWREDGFAVVAAFPLGEHP